MDVRYLSFDGNQSFRDFGLYIQTAEIGFPDKTKARIKIPNSNIYYDYAQIFGDMYEERILEYTFLLAKDHTKFDSEDLEYWKSQVMNWLEPGVQHRIEDSSIPFYYFIGEVQNNPDWQQDQSFGYGTLKVKINCYPYKISVDDMADDLWDSFDFNNDVAQFLEFEVNKETTERIYNASSTAVSPKLIVIGNVTVEAHGEKVTLNAGTYTETEIKLNVGWNDVKLSGNGTIKFSFHKEVL